MSRSHRSEMLQKSRFWMSISRTCLVGWALLGIVFSSCGQGLPAEVELALTRSGLRVADGTSIDQKTGMPKRVLHIKTGATLVLIPAGVFQMGSPESEAKRNEIEKQHVRVIRNPFYLGETELTQIQWERVMGSNPSMVVGDSLPVESVSWNDCQEFLRRAGDALRLPSEAEWEYACRAGTTTPFFFGETINTEQVNYDGSRPYGDVMGGLCKKEMVAARSMPPNAWGLYEMHGNVYEFCQDALDFYPGHGNEMPWMHESKPFPEMPSTRVMRGGAYNDPGFVCRSAARWPIFVHMTGKVVGFRVAMSLPK